MSVLVFSPDAQPYSLEITGELPLKRAQELVGGYVEVVACHDANGDAMMQMIVNEEGKLKGLPLNLAASVFAHGTGMIDPSDCIVGVAVVLTGGNRWS
jgi:uncharacterized protein DUF3846